MNMIKLVTLLFAIGSIAKADIFPHILQKYTNPVLVCTGIASGEIFARAIEVNCDNGAFSEIYGVEENGILVNHSQQFVIPKYINDYKPKNLHLYHVYHNNSVLDLASIIHEINKPITFVLASQFPDWTNPEKNNYVLQELDQIKKHHIKEHTILIDYIYFGNISLESMKKKLLEINAHYRFELENGGHIGKEKNAVLVAYLE